MIVRIRNSQVYRPDSLQHGYKWRRKKLYIQSRKCRRSDRQKLNKPSTNSVAPCYPNSILLGSSTYSLTFDVGLENSFNTAQTTYLDKEYYCLSAIQQTMIVGQCKIHHLECSSVWSSDGRWITIQGESQPSHRQPLAFLWSHAIQGQLISPY